MIPDPLRDRVDGAIYSLALATTPQRVAALVRLTAGLHADITSASRMDLDTMLAQTIAAARLRCPDPQPDAMPGEDDAGGFGEGEG